MSWEENVYSTPEKYGLTTVGTVEWSDGNYQYDKTLILKDDEGKLYYAENRGCSCPSPFEAYEGTGGLITASKYAIAAHLQNRLQEEYAEGDEYGLAPKEKAEAAVARLIEKMMTA